MKKWKWITVDVEKLKNEVILSKNFRELLLRMGYKEGSASRQRLKKALMDNKISVSHFTGKLWAKGKTALDDPRIGKPSEEIFCVGSSCGRSYVKKLIIEKTLKEYKCSLCGLVKWKDKEINLHLDHINGKNNDNRLENLRFLCPNCHSQTPTYCSNVQNRYTDEQILSAAKESASIREVMLKIGMTTGTNYKRLKKLLPHLVKSPPKIFKEKKIRTGFTVKNKSIEWINKIAFSNRKVERPDKETLLDLIKKKSMVQVGKQFSVSDNAIRKWCKYYGIDYKNKTLRVSSSNVERHVEGVSVAGSSPV